MTQNKTPITNSILFMFFRELPKNPSSHECPAVSLHRLYKAKWQMPEPCHLEKILQQYSSLLNQLDPPHEMKHTQEREEVVR